MISLNQYIKHNISKNNINKVKQFLINYYNVNSWEEYVDTRNYGDCQKVCRLIQKNFPKLFDKMLTNIYIDFSEIAKNKIHDDKEMNGNHYVLTKKDEMYDFARGCNCINGIYVMTQMEDNSDKYNIFFTEEEKQLIYYDIQHI